MPHPLNLLETPQKKGISNLLKITLSQNKLPNFTKCRIQASLQQPIFFYGSYSNLNIAMSILHCCDAFLLQGSMPSSLPRIDAIGNFHDLAKQQFEGCFATILVHLTTSHRRSSLLHVQLVIEVHILLKLCVISTKLHFRCVNWLPVRAKETQKRTRFAKTREMTTMLLNLRGFCLRLRCTVNFWEKLTKWYKIR